MSPMVLWMVAGCPAERLGVELPKGGEGSISAEDLQRDVYALTRSEAGRGDAFARRMEQMHLAPDRAEGRVCAMRGGADAPRVIVAAWTDTVPDAAAAAILISVAKGWDGTAPPRRTTWLCLAKAGASLPEGEVLAAPTVTADKIEAIDYRSLRDRTQQYFRSLE